METFSEMAANIQHAYPEQFDWHANNILIKPLENKFWMLGAYDENEQKLYLGIYDMGIGIAESMSFQKYKIEFVQKLFKKNDNISRVKAAFEIGKKGTSTNKSYRGKGLGEVVPNLLKGNIENRLILLTGNTYCDILSDDSNNNYSYINQYLQGTFLYFSVQT